MLPPQFRAMFLGVAPATIPCGMVFFSGASSGGVWQLGMEWMHDSSGVDGVMLMTGKAGEICCIP